RGTDGYIFRSVIVCALLVPSVMWVMVYRPTRAAQTERPETDRAHVRGTDGYIFRSVIVCALLVPSVMWVMVLPSYVRDPNRAS
ncbi:MAG: hypothetical protein J0H02_04655, partial [Armatimonadetes bacterium]|nr:hypothetical protein [Armatimonadota bacterium]